METHSLKLTEQIHIGRNRQTDRQTDDRQANIQTDRAV